MFPSLVMTPHVRANMCYICRSIGKLSLEALQSSSQLRVQAEPFLVSKRNSTVTVTAVQTLIHCGEVLTPNPHYLST